MRRKFGHILNKLANKDEKIVLLVEILDMEYLMNLEEITLKNFLTWVYASKVLLA